MTWEIGALMNSYADIKKSEEYSNLSYDEREKIEENYAKAIELTVKENCGIILPIDECIEWVKGGSIIDYDGFGELLDEDGKEIGGMTCNASYLQKAKEAGACFVAWYNK